MKDFYEVLFVRSESPLKTLKLFEFVFAVADLSKVVLAWSYFLCFALPFDIAPFID